MAFLIDFETKDACCVPKFMLDNDFCKSSIYDNQRIIANGNIIAGIEAKE